MGSERFWKFRSGGTAGRWHRKLRRSHVFSQERVFSIASSVPTSIASSFPTLFRLSVPRESLWSRERARWRASIWLHERMSACITVRTKLHFTLVPINITLISHVRCNATSNPSCWPGSPNLNSAILWWPWELHIYVCGTEMLMSEIMNLKFCSPDNFGTSRRASSWNLKLPSWQDKITKSRESDHTVSGGSIRYVFFFELQPFFSFDLFQIAWHAVTWELTRAHDTEVAHLERYCRSCS